MGKLGARELNVSSDIDLIYLYDHDGETAGDADGRARLANQEYFARAVKRIYALVGDTTEHGFVFRVDLALRPNGNSGPSAVSLDALEEYFQVQGREWERFAWLKSRVVAPQSVLDDCSARALRGAVLPFVFRRYLDYSVFDSLRTLHRQIREQAARRSAGRPERANDVKLSRGGIREIEFTVQLLQVVRGGQFPELRTRPTLDALQRLARADLMPQETADALAAAYEFLRRVEHRIQYLDDQQTHVLPVNDDDLRWIAHTLGYADCCPFLAQLDAHREFVAQEFDKLLGGEKPCSRCNGGSASAAPGRPERPDRRAAAGLCRTHRAVVREPARRWPCATKRARACASSCSAPASGCANPTAKRPGRSAAMSMPRCAGPTGSSRLLRRESYIALLVERPGGAGAPAAHPGRRQVAGALPDAAPGRDRRAGQRRDAGRTLRRRPSSNASSKTAIARCARPARPTRSAC